MPAAGRSKRITRGTTFAISAISTAAYWYTLYSAEFTWMEIFIPKYFLQGPEDGHLALRVVIQYDYVCLLSGAYLWLLYLLRDLKANGDTVTSWFILLALSILLGAVFGIGTMLMLLWAWRQELMTAKVDNIAKTK